VKNLKKFDQINVIPFIDIMLVLLVMVLTTATFIKQGIIPVELPEAKQSDKKENKKEYTVYITKEGKLHFDKVPVTAAELEQKLSAIGKDETVVLRSDKDATFQNFVTVMDMMKKLHHEQLYIVTKD
jgi:biopolymer transport protein ExbD